MIEIVEKGNRDWAIRKDTVDQWQLEHLEAEIWQSFDKQLQLGRITERSTVVDLGGHIGTFALPAAQFVKRVVSVEADAESQALYRINASLQDVPNVECEYAAISDHDGHVTLFVADENWAHSLTNPSKNEIQVPAMTLDTLYRNHRITDVDFLKVNIEGAEFGLIDAVSVITLRRNRFIFAELHFDFAPEADFEAFKAKFTKAGFAYEVEEIEDTNGARAWFSAERKSVPLP